jgi:hypothetical protein
MPQLQQLCFLWCAGARARVVYVGVWCTHRRQIRTLQLTLQLLDVGQTPLPTLAQRHLTLTRAAFGSFGLDLGLADGGLLSD